MDQPITSLLPAPLSLSLSLSLSLHLHPERPTESKLRPHQQRPHSHKRSWMMLRLSLLPREVVDVIFLFAVELQDAYNFAKEEGQIVLPKSLSSIALVSKEWHAVAIDLQSVVQLRSILITVPIVQIASVLATRVCETSDMVTPAMIERLPLEVMVFPDQSRRRAMLQQRSQLTYRRSFITRLRITSLDERYHGIAMNYVKDTLSCTPHLEELDLGRLRASITQLADTLSHASRLCPAWTTLTLSPGLPAPDKRVTMDEEQRQERVFRACPLLRSLTLLPPAYSRRSRTRRHTRETYPEPFWLELVHCCPLLEVIHVRQSFFERSEIIALSDRVIQALRGLRKLHSVHLDFVTMSGEALFDLVMEDATESPQTRRLEIQYGFDTGETFYSMLDAFLKRLVEYYGENPSRATADVALRVTNRNGDVGRDWSAWYLDELQALIEKDLAKLSSAYLLNVIVDKYHKESNSFGSIREFTFASRPVLQRSSSGEEEGYTFVRIDDVLVSRVSTSIESMSEEEDEDMPFMDDGMDLVDYYDSRGELGCRYSGYRGRPTRLDEYSCFQPQHP